MADAPILSHRRRDRVDAILLGLEQAHADYHRHSVQARALIATEPIAADLHTRLAQAAAAMAQAWATALTAEH